MRFKVKFKGKEDWIESESKVKIKDVIKRFEVTPDICVVCKNGEVVTEDENVNEGDFIEIIVAISGGI